MKLRMRINGGPHESMEDEKYAVIAVSGASIVKYKPIFSLDSKYLFVCCGKEIKVFSVASGECSHYLSGHDDDVTGLQTNPKNRLQILSCSLDQSIIQWDYEDGVVLKRHSLHVPLQGLMGFSMNDKIIVLKQPKKIEYIEAWECDLQSESKKCLFKHLQERKLAALGAQGRYVVYAHKRKITVYSFKAKEKIQHKLSDNFDRRITCVTCHPSEDCFVTGLDNGRIWYWWNIFNKDKVTKSSYHWHSLPVVDLHFTFEGSHLLSGGHECVLVKWQYNSREQTFLPRMRAPLTHVICSPDNQVFVTCHPDNSISLISNTFELLQVIDGLSLCHLQSQIVTRSSLRLLYDPRTKALVTNGRVGHLQFYSLETDRQLYDLDIVQENYISPEDLSKPLHPTDVVNAVFSSDGNWLATVDMWDDGVMTPDIQLKFWTYQDESQEYLLNTLVHYPHDKQVVDIKFCPSENNPERAYNLVTSSLDGKFKIWSLVDDTDIYRVNNKWMCDSVGYYRDRAAGHLSFSEDGSLVAVIFTTSITVWDMDTNVLKHTFQNTFDFKCYRFCEFGRYSCSHLLVGVSQQAIYVWNLLTLAVTWKVDLSVQILVPDPLSHFMAVFDDQQKLFVFKPSSPQIVYSKACVSNSRVTCGVFIPQMNKSSTKGRQLEWQSSSQLYFSNEDQELFTISHKEVEKERKLFNSRKIQENLPSTPFSLLLNKERSSVHGTEKIDVTPKSSIIKEILESAAHAQPPVTSLCLPFLQSLLQNKDVASYKVASSFYWWRREPDYNEPGKRPATFFKNTEDSDEESDKMEKNIDSDSDMEVEHSHNAKQEVTSDAPSDMFEWLSEVHGDRDMTDEQIDAIVRKDIEWIKEIKS